MKGGETVEGSHLFIIFFITIIFIFTPRQDNLWQITLWQGKLLLLGALTGGLLELLLVTESFSLLIYFYVFILSLFSWKRKGINISMFLGLLWFQYPYIAGLPIAVFIGLILVTRNLAFALDAMTLFILIVSLAYIGYPGALNGLLIVFYYLICQWRCDRLKGQSLTNYFAHTL